MQIDTSNILFICGGAFVGLKDIIEKRSNESSGFGFNGQIKGVSEHKTGETLKKIQPQDLIKFGLIPEFVGRLPIVVGLDDLDEDALVEIMQKPKNALTKQYTEMFKIDGVELKIEQSAVRAIAKKAVKLKTGARGLRTIMENCMLDLMFLTPSDKTISSIVIDENVINGVSEPKIIKTKKVSETNNQKVEKLA